LLSLFELAANSGGWRASASVDESGGLFVSQTSMVYCPRPERRLRERGIIVYMMVEEEVSGRASTPVFFIKFILKELKSLF